MYMYIVISLVPRLPPLERNYCVTFKLAPAFPYECEFKGHAIIAQGGGAWERGYIVIA